MKPHRATTILVLGILSLVLCQICGIVAWIMGSKDLKEMDAGVMDANGRGMTQAGKICGMVATILLGVGIAAYLVMFVIFAGAMAAGGGRGVPGSP
jgi:hypothetical protein